MSERLTTNQQGVETDLAGFVSVDSVGIGSHSRSPVSHTGGWGLHIASDDFRRVALEGPGPVCDYVGTGSDPQGHAVQPGDRAHFELYSSFDNLIDLDVSAGWGFTYFDEDGEAMGSDVEASTPTDLDDHGWHFREIHVTIPAGVRYAVPWVHVFRSSGVDSRAVDFDDFSLTTNPVDDGGFGLGGQMAVIG